MLAKRRTFVAGLISAALALTLGPSASIYANAQTNGAPHSPATPVVEHLRSRISVYDLRDNSVHVLYTAEALFEAPNWSPDGKYLLANSGGRLYRFDLQQDGTALPRRIALETKYVCNNDKALSPDGKQLAFSAANDASHGSQVFLSSADGSHPHLLVSEDPSYFHGWSHDGRALAIVARRDTNFDIYRIPFAGGAQQRLTRDAGHNDGPDYSPDGRWIYINSDRSGSEQIWRLPTSVTTSDSAQAERVTEDETQDWFPHPSPDGKWLVFLAFPKEVEGHNARLVVQLKMQAIRDVKTLGKDEKTLSTFFGGQGTINVDSWSPDSTRFAFVSYEPLP